MIEKLWKNSGIILLVLLFQTGVVFASEDIPKTGDPAWDTFSQVKKDWMLKLYDIVAEDRPELLPVADNKLEWHLKEMEYDTKKFQYMSEKHPDMIVRDKGLGAFSSLDWFPEFSADLSSKDPDFAKLEKKVAQLKKDLSKSKNLKALEEFLSSLSKNEKHKDKVKTFMTELNRVQKILTRQDIEISKKNH